MRSAAEVRDLLRPGLYQMDIDHPGFETDLWVDETDPKDQKLIFQVYHKVSRAKEEFAVRLADWEAAGSCGRATLWRDRWEDAMRKMIGVVE